MSGSLYRGEKKLIGKLSSGKEIYGNLGKEAYNAQFDNQAERDEWAGIVAREGKGKKGKYGKKKGATRNYVKKKTAGGRSRGGGGGGMSGTNIIYPNVVGRGAYYIGGGIGYDAESGWNGSLKGFYTDQEVGGLGAYSIRRNSHMHLMDLGQPVPKVRNSNMGEAFVINHQEYLGELYSDSFVPGTNGTAFSLQSYNINPGNSKMFPFLSNIARNFQEYEIRGMLICIRSLASDYASTLALGSVFAAADYNVYGDTPTSKVQVENMEYAQSSKPSKSFILPIECDPQNNGVIHKKVAIDDNYHGGDKNNFDWAHLYIGTQGIPQEHTPLCEIHITYEIAFFKEIVNGNDPNSVDNFEGAAWRLTNCAPSIPLGDVYAPMAGDSSDVILDIATQTITFPTMRRGMPGARHYLVFLELTNANGVGASFNIGGYLNTSCSFETVFTQTGIASDTQTSFCGWGSAGSTRATLAWCVKAEVPEDAHELVPSIKFSPGWTIPTATTTRGTLWVVALPYGFDPFALTKQLSHESSEGIPLKNPLLEDYIENEVKRRVQGLKRTTSC